jgi:hypothetical protein
MTTLDRLASDEYRATLRLQHATSSWGSAGKSHADAVREWGADLEARTALDYGCGRGTLAPAVPELRWQEYDPGIEGKDALPSPADLVACTDVLEHIEPDRLTAVLRHLRLLTIKGGYLVISLSRARLTLPDGRNAHLIVENASWWADQLMSSGFHISRVERKKGLRAWIR